MKPKWAESERRAANGNFIANSKKPLEKPKYVNKAIELELLDFKKEIEEKFKASKMNQEFVFPLASSDRGKLCESLESFDETKEYYLKTEQ